MSGLRAPTEEELSRDALTDLEVCRLALQAPWTVRAGDPYDGHDVWQVFGHDGKSFLGVITRWPPTDESEKIDKATAAFIKLARNAMEGWICRAAAAEAEVERLRKRRPCPGMPNFPCRGGIILAGDATGLCPTCKGLGWVSE